VYFNTARTDVRQNWKCGLAAAISTVFGFPATTWSGLKFATISKPKIVVKRP
jgi:hypothetical protein